MDKLVIFDLDGTICDTLEDLKNAVNYAMEKLNLNLVQYRLIIKPLTS